MGLLTARAEVRDMNDLLAMEETQDLPDWFRQIMRKLENRDHTRHYVKLLLKNPQIGAPVLYALYRKLKSGEIPAALDLTLDWYFELGDHTREYGDGHEITEFLRHDRGVCQARQVFLRNGRVDMVGNNAHHYIFDPYFIRETWRALFRDEWSGSFLGGYRVEIRNLDEPGWVQIAVFNNTGWASGCRYPFSSKSYRQDQPRQAPGPGGTLGQCFSWREYLA